MFEPPAFGRRSLVGTLLVYAALVVIVVVASRIAACREHDRASSSAHR
jgi:hypothetical protein